MAIKLLMLVTMLGLGSGMMLSSYERPTGLPNQVQDQEQEPAAEQDPEAEPRNKMLDNTPFMMRKLDAARNIVSGLALEDFELIIKSASDLSLLSQESQWEVFQTDAYIRMSNDFRDSSMRLRETAREKNLDGATLAYFEVTLNCVRCHKYIRTNPQ